MHFIEYFAILFLAQSTTAVDKANTDVHYKKTAHLEFGKQTVEGKLHRPDAALVTAGEARKDSSVLRLRKNFLDKIAASAGEEEQ